MDVHRLSFRGSVAGSVPKPRAKLKCRSRIDTMHKRDWNAADPPD
jgi:hypothetical protein